MTDVNAEEFIRLTSHYHPTGFPPEEDDTGEFEMAYQRTPEHQRWREAWDRALAWEAWDTFLERLEAVFSDRDFGL